MGPLTILSFLTGFVLTVANFPTADQSYAGITIADSATFRYAYNHDTAVVTAATPDALSGGKYMNIFFTCGPNGTLQVANPTTNVRYAYSPYEIANIVNTNLDPTNPCQGGLSEHDKSALAAIVVSEDGFASYPGVAAR